jgi:hypothetical protein
MMIIKARAELAQKTLRSVNEIAKWVGAVWVQISWEGNSAGNPNRLSDSKLADSELRSPSEKCNDGGKFVFVHLRKWFTRSDCMLS